MKILRQMSGLRQRRKPICLAVGFFDGVHLGHQRVLQSAIDRARVIGGEAWALTFDPHPVKVLNPGSALRLLTDTPHKLDLLKQFGMDGCLLIPFTRSFARTSAEDFLSLIEGGIPTLHTIFMGYDWRFGHHGRGDLSMLTAWATRRGLSVTQVPAVNRGKQPVSSTRIRQAITVGDLPEAARLLGRPFSLLGTVVPGNRIGRQLGFPTANLDLHTEARPPTGIYAVQALINRRAYPGIVSFGLHPTVGHAASPVLELHLMDTHMNLYRRRIEVFFLRRLRDEKKFPDLPTLVRQIERDIQGARNVQASPSMKKLWIRTLQRWRPDTIVRQTNK